MNGRMVCVSRPDDKHHIAIRFSSTTLCGNESQSLLDGVYCFPMSRDKACEGCMTALKQAIFGEGIYVEPTE